LFSLIHVMKETLTPAGCLDKVWIGPYR
jgi:hypothetical protein